ncbi:TIGR04063 family PEP-CTERM/XrtA system glycosyltransferase [Desulfoluna spongiiphila]|uniref:TIGR04063 family PEP-CTERM/XrtA system glycosyltransferase n=1 Tax=Desulfoluna spongiiphila TaxID=419481 RepID=UPI00125551A3|nr:TIGR04063 family PEP-CTERM/XrtA system glycosyltransferase [Desulfoluna spongiiphila]VVS94001.1 glycosyltransferase family 1 daro2409 family [Desulfoluna spongiiphila]
MKILHILDHSLPLHSGYAFRSQSIFEAQRNMGYEPVVLTTPKQEENWKGDSTGKDVINGFHYYRAGKVEGRAWPVLYEAKHMMKTYRRIMEILKREEIGLIHAHSPSLNGIPALIAGKKTKTPVVYEIRAFWEDAAVDHGAYKEGAFKYRLTKYIETKVCQKAGHVAILCNGLKKDLEERGIAGDKITPVFNGVNPDDFTSCKPDEEYGKKWGVKGKKVIGFIGSFYRYEGLDLLVKAFGKLSRHDDGCVLLLVGGGEMEAELRPLAKQMGIEDRVIMPGRVPHERVAGVYAMVDVLVYPRYPMRLTELVTPLKPLEAMAMGKALIASSVGGHRELISDGETGVMFPAGDLDGLVGALGRVLSDEHLAATLQQQGKAWVSRVHTWARTTSVYRDIYDAQVHVG